jgi:HAD superfamily hydrolase (TIGR01549 family)
MGRSPDAVLLDLFGTLVEFDSSRIPLLELATGPVRSTLPGYAAMLHEIVPDVSPERFHGVLVDVSTEIARARRASHEETSSQERFARALRRVGVAGGDVGEYAEQLALAHMGQLVAATRAPKAHLALLERLAGMVSLGCVSNFDHGPSARRILEETGMARFLTSVVVSDSFGLRKPAPAIFHAALGDLGVEASSALFVGDTFDEDVRGAVDAGMTAVWLNPTGAAPPPGAVPHLVVGTLSDVEQLVKG